MSFSIEDLNRVIEMVLTAQSTTFAPPVEQHWAGVGENSQAHAVLGDEKLLQQAELMMAELPVLEVAACVLNVCMLNVCGDDPASATASPPLPPLVDEAYRERVSRVLAAWARSAGLRFRRNAGEKVSARAAELNWDSLLERWGRVYASFANTSLHRCHLLTWLAWQTEPGLRRWVRCLVEDPPANSTGIPLFFAPLLKREGALATTVFPELLAAMAQPELATAIIDLANFYYRNKSVRPHPAATRVTPLANLLSQATQRLLQIEQAPAALGLPAAQLSAVINDSVGLITAISDALALIGDRTVVGKIFPGLEVKHRRVQLESAHALAALGEEEGKQALVGLAEQAVVRRRVIAYAKALNIEQRIDPKFTTAAALAETELTLWLSHPQQMGFAPLETKLVDQRTQFWPGFEAAVECFLIEYRYPFAEKVYQNVGLVGPITHSFSVDLHPLPVDDIYAVFAGWQVKHPEIFAVEKTDWTPHQSGTVARLRRRMSDQSLLVKQDVVLGHCLGQWVLVSRAVKSERDGWAVADSEQCLWLPDDAGFTNFDASLVWYLFLGRLLLKQFNA